MASSPKKKNAPPARTRKPASPGSARETRAYTGIPGGTLDFLDGLEQHNDKKWFDAHREEYERYYVGAATTFVSALGPKLQRLAPSIHFEPRVNGSIMRVHRDVRFSKDKRPYKPHLDLWFWQGERKGWNAPGFFFRLTSQALILGSGIHRFEPQQLAAYRAAVLEPASGKALAKTLAALTDHSYVLGQATRKTVPRGLPADHERTDLLLHEGLIVVLETALPAELSTPAFIEYCVEHYKRFVPLHAWLTRWVATSGAS
jgi:uncharacterized protein (TIGR02453 family)